MREKTRAPWRARIAGCFAAIVLFACQTSSGVSGPAAEVPAAAGPIPLTSQPQPPRSPALCKAQPDKVNPLFYKGTRTDLPGKIYLLGSVHLAKKNWYPLSMEVETAFEQSDALAFEISMTPEAEAEAATKLLERGLLPKGRSLWQELGPDISQRLRKRLRKLSAPEFPLSAMRPWMAAISVYLMELEHAGFKPEHGVDRYFQQRAEKRRVSALETLDEHLGALAGISDEASILDIQHLLENGVEQEMQELEQAWKAGDLQHFKVWLKTIADRSPGSYQSMVVSRNRTMARQITAALEREETTFVVVGTAHLVGTGSVVERLQQAGVEVQRVMPLPVCDQENIPEGAATDQ